MRLTEKKVALLATDGFEQRELFGPYETMVGEGADVHIISNKKGEIKGWQNDDWGKSIVVNYTLDEVKAEHYDALMLPGGLMNPDTLRMNKDAVTFVREFFEQGKPVAAICHAPWLLIEANVVEGRKMTSYPSIRTDLENAGAKWVDEEVVVDSGLVTSRHPGDLPAFKRKLVEEIREGVHEEQAAQV